VAYVARIVEMESVLGVKDFDGFSVAVSESVRIVMVVRGRTNIARQLNSSGIIPPSVFSSNYGPISIRSSPHALTQLTMPCLSK